MKLRVFVDGASRGNPGPAALGVVVQDARGRIVAEIAEFFGEATNNVAEYRALLRGLREAAVHGADDLEIFADSDLLVRQITGSYRVKSTHLIPLHQETLAALAAFRRWRIERVPRGKNAAADALANRAIDEVIPARHVELTALVVKEGAQYRATVPALPGCEVLAPTMAAALERLERAAAARLAALRASGGPLPKEHRIRVNLAEDA